MKTCCSSTALVIKSSSHKHTSFAIISNTFWVYWKMNLELLTSRSSIHVLNFLWCVFMISKFCLFETTMNMFSYFECVDAMHIVQIYYQLFKRFCILLKLFVFVCTGMTIRIFANHYWLWCVTVIKMKTGSLGQIFKDFSRNLIYPCLKQNLKL